MSRLHPLVQTLTAADLDAEGLAAAAGQLQRARTTSFDVRDLVSHPVDDAELYAASLPPEDSPFERQSGAFTAPGYTLERQRPR
jgi:hypothetical protein